METASYGRAAVQSLDIYYDNAESGHLLRDQRRPVFIFVGGGGWQGTDHVNSHPEIASMAVEAGFVAVVLRHRPTALSPLAVSSIGTVCVCVAAAMLCSRNSLAPLLPWAIPSLFTASACAVMLGNWLRDAVSMAEVVHDVAKGIALVGVQLRERIAAHGGDSSKLVLCGNSSGGHLLSQVAWDLSWWPTLAPTTTTTPYPFPYPKPLATGRLGFSMALHARVSTLPPTGGRRRLWHRIPLLGPPLPPRSSSRRHTLR